MDGDDGDPQIVGNLLLRYSHSGALVAMSS
jgi:hypothetical protein